MPLPFRKELFIQSGPNLLRWIRLPLPTIMGLTAVQRAGAFAIKNLFHFRQVAISGRKPSHTDGVEHL
jgi:hypothetical protein